MNLKRNKINVQKGERTLISRDSLFLIEFVSKI